MRAPRAPESLLAATPDMPRCIVQTHHIPRLRPRLKDIAGTKSTEAGVQRPIVVDDVVPMADAGWPRMAWLSRMAPFGEGNPAPLWRSDAVSVRGLWMLRQGHMHLSTRSGAATRPAIAFRQADLAEHCRSSTSSTT